MIEPAAPSATRIGWIGTGVMGSSMCGHLLEKGYTVTLTTRTRTRAEDLVAAGAAWADTPADVAGASDIVFSMVGFPEDVREVLLGDAGALAGCRPGTVLVDMTTSEPELAVEIGAAAGSWSLSNLAPRIIAGDFAPGFFVDHLVKDLGIALAEAERSRLTLPGLALAHQLYVALQAQHRGRDGTQSLVHALGSLSGLTWPPAP